MSETPMFDPARHAALATTAWDPGAVRAAIQEIVDDAVGRFDAEAYWPSHPQEDGVPDGNASPYMGAAGMLWALDFMKREGAADHTLDIAEQLPRLLETVRQQYAFTAQLSKMDARSPAWLFADPLVLLMLIRAGSSVAADELHARIADNLDLPTLELMWGFAGAMLAVLFAAELTGEARWRALFAAQAERLLADLQDGDHGPLWTFELYGSTTTFLGPVHGYAGNMIPLLRGWDWLTDAQQARVGTAVPATLAANAQRGDMGVNWPAVVSDQASIPLVQHCHGAAGMVTALAHAHVADAATLDLLRGGGELTWSAGPLAKGSNLCHGTGGNGFAFLKLHALTDEPIWRHRAQAFAMTAIDQCRAARAEHGRGRYTLWTGDIGLACYLHEVLRGSARFPTIDVF
jgi:hypothetical protein